jgi:transglutaminase-like putative cysteine protease
MRLDRAFHALNIALVMIVVLAHEVAAEQYLYLLPAAIACAIVWRRQVRGRPIQLGDTLSTVICVMAFSLAMLINAHATDLRGVRALDFQLPTVGHFLITCQVVYLMRKRPVRETFWLYLISVVLMTTTAMLMPGFAYAPFFLAYALIGSAALTCFNAHSEARRAGIDPATVRIPARMLLASAPLIAALLAPLALVFMLLPRSEEPTVVARSLSQVRSARTVTGFSETTRLGDVGEITESPELVMRVSVTPLDDRAPERPGALLLRGASFSAYVRRSGAWQWLRVTRASRRVPPGGQVRDLAGRLFPGYDQGAYVRRQVDVRLEPLRSRQLFVPFCPEKITAEERRDVYMSPITHDLHLWRRHRGSLEYSAVFRDYPLRPPEPGAPARPLRGDVARLYLQLPPDLAPRVRALAAEIAPIESLSRYERARRILAYLSDGSRFSYTLTLNRTPGVEPVEDFLFNRRVGHCEYFASSMVLLLRCAGIPARLVNGYKVSEYNPISGHYVVRQRDAHAWVEAYLDRAGGWRTFDPSVLREGATPRPALARRLGRNLLDTASHLWVRNVLTYSAEQQAEVYGLFSDALVNVQEALGRLRDPAEAGWERLRRVVTRWGWLAGVIIFFATGWAAWLRFKPKRRGHAPPHVRAALRFYGAMEATLRPRGFERATTATPWEFRDRLDAEGWPAMAPVNVLTRAFCDVRYGGAPLTPERAEALHAALAALKAVPRKTPGARRGTHWERS